MRIAPSPSRAPGRPAAKLRGVGTCLLLALAAACSDVTAPRPEGGPRPEPGPGRWNALGLVEVTLSGLGGPAPSARANVVGGASVPGGASHAVSTIPGGSGNGSIQLRSVSSGSFTVGTRAGGGFRYVYSTFQVRNAASNGTAYDTDRHNLTLLAVATPSTLGGTAVSRLSRYDGSAASAAIAAGIRPTGAVAFDPSTGTRIPLRPDVLQVLDEGEVASVPVVSGGSVLPWGFVVGNPAWPDSRTLPANPAADRWDGLVTFAFKVPLQPTAAEDPFTVSFVFVAVDDSEARVTLSLEEQTASAAAAARARAGALGASLTTLPGYPLEGARLVCGVRVAGTRNAPTGQLFAPVAADFDSLALSPFSPAAGRIAANARLGAVFNCPVNTPPTAETFAVRGSQSGRMLFTGGGFTGLGTRTIGTPPGAFFPGEEVEVVVAGALRGGGPRRVGRYRVAAGSGPATLQNTGAPLAFDNPVETELADVNGDGRLDVVASGVVANPDGSYAARFASMLGTGSGGFGTPVVSTPGVPGLNVTPADMNADGRMDVVTIHGSTGSVVVLLGDGAGRFAAAPRPSAPTGTQSSSASVADFNGDGRLDVAVVDWNASTVSAVLGDGTGGFVEGSLRTYSVGLNPAVLVSGDVNGDGRVELVTQQGSGAANVHVLLGDGTGAFAVQPAVDLGYGKFVGDLALGDINGDGRLDLAGAADRGEALVLLGLGNGRFAAPTVVASGFYVPISIAMGDLNGDGRMDLVLGTRAGFAVLAQNAAGGFTTVAGSTSPVGPVYSPVLGDVNGDRALDAVLIDGDTSAIRVLLNR